jgi:hypothetical protein
LILDNYEFKMDSVDNLEILRIKKEKERAKIESEGTPGMEPEKKPPPGKIVEPEIVKTFVPIKVDLKEIEGQNEKALKVY